MSTFRDSTSVCFWCKGPFRGSNRGLQITHEQQTIRTCIECACDVGRKMTEAGWESVGKATGAYL